MENSNTKIAPPSKAPRMRPNAWVITLHFLFPFLRFHDPSGESALEPFKFHQRMMSWILQKKDNKPDGPEKSWLLASSLRFGLLLCGSLLVTFFVVYVCFSFNHPSTFPTVGSALYWWVIARNIIIIVVIHYLCRNVLVVNANRIAMLNFDMKAIDPDLAYVGVFHYVRKVVSFITARPFRVRWFTTFLSDSILLGGAYGAYAIASIMRAVIDSDDISRVLSEAANVYKGFLIFGLVVYSLEFYPKVVPGRQALSQGILLFIISMNFADFFLFVGEKTSENGVIRAFTALAQLFLTHSSVLLSAIIGNHHQHAHLSPDLPLVALWKAFVWFLIVGVWMTYAILHEIYASEDGSQDNWIPQSFSYAVWGVRLGGGLICLLMAIRYARKNDPALQLVRLGDAEATILNKGVKGEEGEQEDESKLDYDIMLILITYTLATIYYSSETFASYSLSEFFSMAQWITSPIGPIGLAVLAATVWWKPPTRPRLFLYLALMMAALLVIAMEVAEDCHLTSETPICCGYPALSDSNHHFEEPHEAPICIGLLAPDSSCLVGGFIGGESNEFVFPVSFSAVADTTRSVSIEVFVNDSLIFKDVVTKVSDIIMTTTCRENSDSYVIGGTTISTQAGCSGDFLYILAGTPANLCNPSTNPTNSCRFEVKTKNCAFVESDILTVVPLTPSISMSFPPEASDLFKERIARETEKPESTFYFLFKLIGLAALIEFYFTVFGVFLKLIFLSECRTAHMVNRKLLFKKRTTVMFGVQHGDLVPNEEVMKELASDEPQSGAAVSHQEAADSKADLN